MEDVGPESISGAADGENFPPEDLRDSFFDSDGGNNEVGCEGGENLVSSENFFFQEFNPVAHGLDPKFRLTNLADMKG